MKEVKRQLISNEGRQQGKKGEAYGKASNVDSRCELESSKFTESQHKRLSQNDRFP